MGPSARVEKRGRHWVLGNFSAYSDFNQISRRGSLSNIYNWNWSNSLGRFMEIPKDIASFDLFFARRTTYSYHRYRSTGVEYIFKCIFHATNFDPLFSIRSKFVIPLRASHTGNRRRKKLPGTLSFIWNPLRVLMHSHYSARFFLAAGEGNKASSIQASMRTKVTILINLISLSLISTLPFYYSGPLLNFIQQPLCWISFTFHLAK